VERLKTSIFRIDNKTKSSDQSSDTNTWIQAIAEAENLVNHKGGSYIDPVQLVGKDLTDLKKNITQLLGSKHPMLNAVNKYYFNTQGKHIRPLIVLLMSQATSIAPKHYNVTSTDTYQIIDIPLTPQLALNEGMAGVDRDTPARYLPTFSTNKTFILPTQRRLAEITEMIHTASLFHDDVIDISDSRRNQPSANACFGNKITILAGDFLLARASVALARLRNPEVIELLATVIANLVEGEFMQLKSTQTDKTIFERYIEKTYMKTASLIAKSCRASSVLGGCTEEVADIAYNYGKNLGLAFQVFQ